MLKKVIFYSALVFLVSCQAHNKNSRNETLETEYNPSSRLLTPAPEEIQEIDFMDSAAFDLDLSTFLRKEYQTVKVLPTQPISINNIPPRLDEWFFRVKESGGSVKAKDISLDLNFRGIVGAIIDVIVAIFEKGYNKALYAPAKKYNVVIEYFKETGEIKQILFNNRKLEES